METSDTTSSTGFNPRAHVGRDELQPPVTVSYKVSIHAPTWGATLVILISAADELSFNPRAHVGRDTTAQSNG